MDMMRPCPCVGSVLLLAVVGWTLPALAQGPLVKARESFAAAAYEDCLSALDVAALAPGEFAEAGEYRALCLLGLNRERDAADAIEQVIRTVPTYTAPANSTPRLLSLIGTVRKEVLPSVIQERFATARRAYDEGDHPTAADGFRLVLTLLETPVGAAEDPAAADYRTLASAFLDLIDAATAHAAQPGPSSAPQIFTAEEHGVVPPVAISQQLPKWSRPAATLQTTGFRGLLEVVIDTDGRVASAVLVDPVHPSYDGVLLRAAREWTYEPARREGTPVRFRKVLAITLQHR